MELEWGCNGVGVGLEWGRSRDIIGLEWGCSGVGVGLEWGVGVEIL